MNNNYPEQNSSFNENILFSEGPTVLFKWDADREKVNTIFVSDNCKLFGYSSSELIGKPFLDFIHPEDIIINKSAYKVEFEKLLRNEKIDKKFLEMTYRFLCKDGKYKWVKDYSYPIFENEVFAHVYGYIIDINELVIAKNLVDESEAKFRDMANSAPVLIWTDDQNGNCNYVNKAWIEFTGLNIAEAYETKWVNLVHPDDIERFNHFNNRNVVDYKPFELEYRLRASNGEYKWILDRGIPRFDINNEFIGYIGTCIDLTEQKNAANEIIEKNKTLERALTEAQKFANMLNKSTNSVLLTDSQHQVKWINKSFSEITKFKLNEVYNKDLEEILDSPKNEIRNKIRIQRALQERISIKSELLIAKKDKSTFWVELTLDPLYSNSGIFEGFIALLNDVTERKIIEEKIIEQNIELDNVQRALNSSTFITMLDKNAVITNVNHKFRISTGLSKEKYIGLKHKAFIEGFLPKEEYTKLMDISNSNRFWRGELQETIENGSTIWLDSTIMPIKNKSNEHTGYIIVGINITNRIEYQNQLKELNDNLEQKISDRTTILQTINKEKDNILAIVSHDLKNPLSGLMLNIEMLEELAIRNNDSILLNKTKNISNSANKMYDIISKVLDVYRMETGNISPKPKDFELLELLKLSIEEISLQANKKNLNITIHGNAKFTINSDYLFVSQIIDNLLSNAVKYSYPDSDITIEISSSKEHFTLKVIDQGVGVADFELSNIFEKFAKVSSWPTAGENKTGIGLSTVKRLTEILNGSITCESSLNKGSVFILTLPIKSK